MQFIFGILLLCGLIFFHELGHFLFAKLLKVRVLVFSIGFGPKILKKKIKGTEYCLSAIPLGGYVKMFGESYEEDLSDEEKKISFLYKPLWQKSLVAFAGPLFNFILPIFLLFFLNFGREKVFAPIIGTLLPDGQAMKLGLLPNDRILAADDKKIEYFNQLSEYISKNFNKTIKLSIERKTPDDKIINLDINITPEIKSNNNILERNQKVGRIGIMPGKEKPVIFMEQNSPFLNSGLNNFDEILSIDDHKASSAYDILIFWPLEKKDINIKIKRGKEEKIINIKQEENFNIDNNIILKLDEKNINKDIIEKSEKLIKIDQEFFKKTKGLTKAKGIITKIDLNHELIKNWDLKLYDRIIAVDGEPFLGNFQFKQFFMPQNIKPHIIAIKKNGGDYEIKEIILDKRSQEGLASKEDFFSLLGFELFESFSQGEMLERKVGFFEALSKGFSQTFDIAFLTAKSFWLMIKGDVSTSQIGGPLMLFDVAREAAQKGIYYYIFIMCMLSINLGLLNILPIPALDGGHLLLFGIEAIKGKPLSVKTRNLVTQIGVIILLLVMALAIFNDLSRLFRK